MAIVAGSRPAWSATLSAIHFYNSPGSVHEIRSNLYSPSPNRVGELSFRDERIFRKQHPEEKRNELVRSSSWPFNKHWKRQGIAECRSQSRGRSGEGEAELGIQKYRRPELEDGGGRSCKTIWRKVKEVTTAVVLSAVISLHGSCDYSSVLAAEVTLDSSTSSPPTFSVSERVRLEVDNPQCSEGIIRVADESSSSVVEPVTNESVVDEVWQVVNEFFLDARHHSWSAEDWAKIREEAFRRPIRSKMAAHGVIKGMLATLKDPYTRFLTPDQFRELSKYDVTGVGLNIGEVENGKGEVRLGVLGIVLGSPAQMMGVRQGDELVAVNGTSVKGLSAFEAASLIQGPKGTPVSIEIRHGPCEDVKTIIVSRQQDVRTPVFYRLERTQNPGELIGYIRLREFNALAKKDLVIAMKRLQEAGATSFLLDLQDNPGGLVQAGIEIARLFLDGGETISR